MLSSGVRVYVRDRLEQTGTGQGQHPEIECYPYTGLPADVPER